MQQPIQSKRKKPQGMMRLVILTGSSFFGLGYLPLAPGTWGSVGGVLLWWLWSNMAVTWFAAATLLLTLVGIYVAGRAEHIYGTHDMSHIVIDEVAGMLITAIGVPCRLPEVIAAFVLFRLLDTIKPPPIGNIDANMAGGLGVVLDDVVAGVIGCVLLHGVCWYLGGWW